MSIPISIPWSLMVCSLTYFMSEIFDCVWIGSLEIFVIRFQWVNKNAISRNWLLRGQTDIWYSCKVSSRKSKYIRPAIGCCCKAFKSLFLYPAGLVMVILLTFFVLWAGCLGINCACFWEGLYLSWWSCSDNGSECELWDVSMCYCSCLLGLKWD